MTDRITPEQRRKAMKNVHSTDTSIEIKMRKALWHEGIRYRKNFKELPGKPDIAITKWKIAVFCDGSFWHGRGFEAKKPIESHRLYWVEKIRRNVQRDMETNQKLKDMGWTVLRFWDKDICENLNSCVLKVKEAKSNAEIKMCMEKHA